MVGKMILCMTVEESERSLLDDLSPIKKGNIILLDQFSHVMAGV